MEIEVDYLKLSEQYASFLAAIGGVSITVLTLVLTFDSTSTNKDLREFLVAALVVATVSCFIGAHMMADTAAFISNAREVGTDGRGETTSQDNSPPIPSNGKASGARLFLLASTNIFVAIILVLFALMLLPIASGKVDASRFTPISAWVFGSVVFGTICWLVRAAIYRVPAPNGWYTIACIVIVGVVWSLVLCVYLIPKGYLLCASFIPIVIITVALLLYHTWTFKDGGDVYNRDIWLFSSVITISYTSLVIAAIKTMPGN